MSELTQEMIDAFSMAMEMEALDGERPPMTLAGRVTDIETADNEEDRQYAIVHLAADLCYLYNGAVDNAREEREKREAAEREAQRVRRGAEAAAIRKAAEESEARVRDRQQQRDLGQDVQPFTGSSYWSNPTTAPRTRDMVSAMDRDFRTLGVQALNTSFYDWAQIGYTEDPVITEDAFDTREHTANMEECWCPGGEAVRRERSMEQEIRPLTTWSDYSTDPILGTAPAGQ